MCFEWSFQVVLYFQVLCFLREFGWAFFWWTGEYINFTCYNVVFTTIILILEKLKIWWLTQQRQKMFQNSCHGQQKISDFCGGNVGIFKWLFSRQKMSAKYFMMHKKVGDDNKNALNGILIFFCGNREINLLSEKDKKKLMKTRTSWCEEWGIGSLELLWCVWKIGRTNLAAHKNPQIRKSFSLLLRN